MESQPQNPEFRINPDNCHPCIFFLVLKQNIESDQNMAMMSEYMTLYSRHTIMVAYME